MSIRIPIRKWEKVETDRWGMPKYRNPGYVSYTKPDRFEDFTTEEQYNLEVMINGEILSSTVRVPKYLGAKDQAGLREYIVASLSRQIGAVIADEVRRTIV